MMAFCSNTIYPFINTYKYVDVVIPVYNNIQKLGEVFLSLKNQNIPKNFHLNIIVVNDGSNLLSSKYLQSQHPYNINILVEHNQNRGRAAARNSGWKSGYGEFIIFIDSDCIPQGNDFIKKHIDVLSEASISCGNLTSQQHQNQFWNRYQNDLAIKRERLFNNHNPIIFTTANLAITRKHLETIEGFCEEYTHYGFEDRDLLIRSIKVGANVAYVPCAIVDHADELSLKEICKRMYEAGRYSSPTFRKYHQSEYSSLSYSKCDVNLNKYLKLFVKVAFPFFFETISIIELFLKNKYIPYSFKKIILKIFSSIYYMYGTLKQS